MNNLFSDWCRKELVSDREIQYTLEKYVPVVGSSQSWGKFVGGACGILITEGFKTKGGNDGIIPYSLGREMEW